MTDNDAGETVTDGVMEWVGVFDGVTVVDDVDDTACSARGVAASCVPDGESELDGRSSGIASRSTGSAPATHLTVAITTTIVQNTSNVRIEGR